MEAETLGKKTPNDYPVRLNDYLEGQVGKDFIWGETHCTALVFGSLDAIYETDYTGWHKTTHNVDSKEKALELCEAEETLKVFNDIGFMEIDLFSIKTGDVVYVKSENYECCYVYTGSNYVSSRLGDKVRVTLAKSLKETLKGLEFKVFTIIHK